MSPDIKIGIDIPKRLERMPERFRDALVVGLEIVGGTLVNDMKATRRFKDVTGNLRNSIHALKVDARSLTVQVQAGMEYADAVNARTGYVQESLDRSTPKYRGIIERELRQKI